MEKKKESRIVKILKYLKTFKNITSLEAINMFGDYDNWTTAKIVDIRPTEYEHIKEVDYTIPRYCGEEIHTHRMVDVEVRV